MVLAVCGLIFLLTVGSQMAQLPEPVAIHFDSAGNANGWMSRSAHAPTFLGLGLGVSALLVGLARYAPQWINMPTRSQAWKSPRHLPRARPLLIAWTMDASALTMLWLAALHTELYRANLLKPPTLTMTFGLVVTVMYVVGIGVLTVRLIRRLNRLVQPPSS
jgi:uncharacterized membrane protein